MSRIEDGGAVEAGLVETDQLFNPLRLRDERWLMLRRPDWVKVKVGEVQDALEGANILTEYTSALRAEITRLRAEVDHWKRQAEAAQNNATLFQQDCAFHVAEKARKDEALKEAAEYLDALEADLIRNDADMGIDTEIPPSLIADRCRAALSKASQAEGGAA